MKGELKNRTVASQNDIVLIGGHERKKTSEQETISKK